MKLRSIFLCFAGITFPLYGGTLIQLDFDSTVDEAQKPIYNAAADFWNSVITGFKLIYDGEGNVTPHSLTIAVSSPDIDGPGNILGQAGPTSANYYDNNPEGAPTIALGYASEGLMKFDSADVAGMISDQTFYGVILHEMAHVLGIGTLWTHNNNVNGTNWQLYEEGSGQYTGPNALAAWKSEFNQPTATYVPVELGGGEGTANGHWNEVDGGAGNTGFVSNISGLDFRYELMTGWSSDVFFLSTVTLGALEDIGYDVDYSKAGIITMVPEPSNLLLLFSGVLLTFYRKRRS